MSFHGVGRLHIVSGTVKAIDYIEILQNKLLPTARDLLGNQSWIFQDDNAPCHRAKVVQKWGNRWKCDRQTHIRNMAQEMGLVPKGLISRYFAETQPEVRIENNISSLLHEKETPDDIKAKLLSDLIPTYQRVMQTPPPPKPFEIPPELLTEPELPLTNIPEKHSEANYTFNDKNEFKVYGKPEYRSNVVDLFRYMMKNDQRVLTPTGFAKFYAALRHVNIPLEWIELAHRTLRERLYRAFTYRNSFKYYDILPELVHSYKHSIHRAHGFEPTKLTTDDEPELYKRLYHSNVDPQFSFTAGDIVRLSKAHKSYLPGWTEETIRIYKRYPTIHPTYTIQDFNSKEIEGRFYSEELLTIDKSTNDYWAIEKIIRTKGKGASRQSFVKSGSDYQILKILG
ncbi:uncharacterized transposon-derived protein F54H12.3 [Trichonephila clavipes]|uniref:Uncharacterized transposon-derived protein F54H12.3 n=1 Tax=Trichonephila clavipes TaxID=2585209 RepID=A0A8X6VSG0_TRICX|nr:uncharacterized transposon-derived protein F54H12.3 [Trichonephila clavipes]